MKKDTRKTITFKLAQKDTPDFQAAKQKAERELGFTMSDSEFAGRVVRLVVKQPTQEQPKC